MSYTTEADLIARYTERRLIELTDPEGLGVLGSSVIAVAVADADAEIDAYLANVYALPLSEVPTNLARIAAEIVWFRLHGDHPTEGVRQRFEDCRDFLRRVAKGEIELGVAASGGEPAADNSIGIAVAHGSDATAATSSARVFSMDTLDQF